MKISNLVLLVVATTDQALSDGYKIKQKESHEFLDGPNMWEIFKSFFNIETPQLLKDIAKLNKQVPSVQMSVPYNFGKPNAKNDLKKYFPSSLISYCTKEKVLFKYCICHETFSEIHTIEKKGIDSVVVVAVNKKTKVLVVSYRPTISLQNWKTTQNYSKVSMDDTPSDVKVHGGFYKYYVSTIDKTQAAVESIIAKPAYKDYPLLLTGYSLGAAIATISLPGWSRFLAQRNDTRIIEVYSYASPRIGNKALADYINTFDIPVIRYTNRNDVVNHLPPRSLGYVHVGAEFYDRKSKNSKKSELIQCSETWDEDPNCANSADTPYSFFRHLYPFDKFIPLPPYCEA